MSDDQEGCEWVNVSSGTGPAQIVTDKRPLNGCVCVCVCARNIIQANIRDGACDIETVPYSEIKRSLSMHVA